MDRQPALMDPRTPIPHVPPSPPPRLLPWSFVWFAVLVLTVAAGIAWFAIDPPVRLSALNLQSAPDKEGSANGSKSNWRPVSIAYVEPAKGVVSLYPVRQGRITKMWVNEGDDVKEGAKLFKIDDAFARKQRDEAKLALDGAKKKKEQAQQLVEQHAKGLKAQEAKIAAREADVEVAEAAVAKARKFHKERLGGSEEDTRIAEKTAEKARAGVRAEEAELERLRAMKPELAVEAADLEIRAKELQLEKADLDVDRHTEYAPSQGKVLRSYINEGETLGSNPMRPALEFAPAGDRIVRAEVEQEFAGHVRVGMKAQVQDYDAGNGMVIEGEVTRVSDWIAKKRHQIFEPMQFNDVRTMDVIIRLKGDGKNKLRIGQRVRVTLEP